MQNPYWGIDFVLIFRGRECRVYARIGIQPSINKDNITTQSLFLVNRIAFKRRDDRKQNLQLFQSLQPGPCVLVLPRAATGRLKGFCWFDDCHFQPAAGGSFSLGDVRYTILKDGGLHLKSLKGDTFWLLVLRSLSNTVAKHLVSAT